MIRCPKFPFHLFTFSPMNELSLSCWNFEEEDIDITTCERRCSVESLGDNTAVLRAVQEKAALWYSTGLSLSLSLSLHRAYARDTGAWLDVARVVSVCSYAKRARDLRLFCEPSRLSSALSLSFSLSRSCSSVSLCSCQPSLSRSLSFTTSPAVTISFSHPSLSLSLSLSLSRSLSQFLWVVSFRSCIESCKSFFLFLSFVYRSTAGEGNNLSIYQMSIVIRVHMPFLRNDGENAASWCAAWLKVLS